MILLKALSWDNCFSYGPGNTINLAEASVTQILGANGMGKSSIPLIIEEVLYNKNSKGVKKADIPNRYINDGYNIQLSFDKDDMPYVVCVERKGAKIKVTLHEDGIDISSHTATNTYKTLQSIIGIDFKTFSQLVYQSTNASLQFLSATDTNRKKFLIDLLSLEVYLEFLDIFKEAHKNTLLVTNGVRAQVDTIEKWLKNNNLEDTTLQELLKLEINTDDDEQRFRELSIELNNISFSNKKIKTNNQYKELLSKIDMNILKESEISEYISYDEIQNDLGGKQAIVSNAKQMVVKLKQLGDVCPTCEQDIPPGFKNDLIEAESELASNTAEDILALVEKIDTIKENNRLFNLKRHTQSEWESLYQNIDNDLPKFIIDKDDLEARINVYKERLHSAVLKRRKIADENEARTKKNARIQVIQEQTAQFQADLDEAQKLLVRHEKELSHLEVLKKAFSTNGILAYKIENLVKELEELTNNYLAELSDGRFTLEFVVSNDKLNVEITDNGNIVDISALSSGELARVNTSTLIAIRKLMSSISKSRINVLFLDEVIAVLDDTGREKLVEVLLAEENLNTYIVSHQWEHPLLAKLNIVKQNDISIIEA